MKAIYVHAVGALALSFALAACVSSVEPPLPAPTPAAAPTPSPMPSPAATPVMQTPVYDNYLDAPQTPGTWFYADLPDQSRAVYGESRDTAVFLITCLKSDRVISLVRANRLARAKLAKIRTETIERSLTLAPKTETDSVISASIPANDPLLDAMAITKGRFAVETAGMPTLYLPAWVEVSRVIEDCR